MFLIESFKFTTLIVPVPVKQPWIIWVDALHESVCSDNVTTTKHNCVHISWDVFHVNIRKISALRYKIRQSPQHFLQLPITPLPGNKWDNIINHTHTILSTWIYKTRLGVTQAPFVIFSVSNIFDPAKVPVRFFASHSYLTGVTASILRRHLSNINVIFNS